MPKGVYERNGNAQPSEPRADLGEARDNEGAPNNQMFPVKLLRNYVPKGSYEIIGYHRAAVIVKGADGVRREVEPATFVKGEQPPAFYPGTGFPNKVWKKTYIRLPIDEAKDVVAKQIGERADALPG